MLSFKKLALILSFFFIQLGLNSAESHPGITGEAFAYLKTKEVPKDLKQKLDKIFYSEGVARSLELIYTDVVPFKLKVLVDMGFEFFQSNRVFRHKSLPNYIFKIADMNYEFRNEMKNAGRIRFAELLNQNGKGILKAPTKYAYMPYIYRTEHISLPICIVVSEFVERKVHPISRIDHNKRRLILEANGYNDDHSGNIYDGKEYCMVIDTEPHKEKINYPPIIRAKL